MGHWNSTPICSIDLGSSHLRISSVLVVSLFILKRLLDGKEIKPVNPKGNQSWIFIERTDIKAEAPILWPPDVKNWKRPWWWERLKAGGEGDDKGWDGWMVSPTQWTWVWVGSGSWWWEACHAAVHGVAKSRTWLSDWTERFWLCRSQQIIENS